MKVNGKEVIVLEDQQKMSLLQFLREVLDLTGTKNGCNIGVCGACTVLWNNQTIKACKKQVSDVLEGEIITIEGMQNADGSLHPLQQAFLDAGAIQCGFCTPGMVLTAHAFLLQNPNPNRAQIRKAISANLCRCTGYQQIIDAVEAASTYYR